MQAVSAESKNDAGVTTKKIVAHHLFQCGHCGRLDSFSVASVAVKGL